MSELMTAMKAIDALPREPWAHFREVDGTWERIEHGIAPPLWREMSNSHRLFSIESHEPLHAGDRFVIGEDIYEVSAGRKLVRYEAGTSGSAEPSRA